MRAIHWAVKCRHYGCISKLIEGKADVEVRDASGRTPLSKAVSMGDVKAMDILLQEGGADPDSQDCDGRTAVYVAARRIGGGDPTATETFEKMIEHGVDLDKVDKHRRTVTNWCTLANKPDLLKILASAETPPNFEIQDDMNRTALDWAVYRRGRGKCAHLLDESGAIQYERHTSIVNKAREDATTAHTVYQGTQRTLSNALNTELFEDLDTKKVMAQTLPATKEKIKQKAFFIGGSDWKMLFRKYDDKFDGVLNMEDLRIAIRRDLQISTNEVSQKDLLLLFDVLDEGNSGSISIEELIQELDETLKGRPRTPEVPTYRDTRGHIVPAEIANFKVASTKKQMSWVSPKGKSALPSGHVRVVQK